MKSIVDHIRQSLSLKLSTGILLLAIPIFVLSLGITYLQSRSQIKRDATGRAAVQLCTTLLRVDRSMNLVEGATDANAWLAIDNFQPDALLALSRRIVAMNPNVNGCSITAEPYLFAELGKHFSVYSLRQGDSIVTVREQPYEYFEKDWYKTPAELGKSCWEDPFYDYTEGTLSAYEMIIPYCKPLYSQSGQFMGVLSTGLSMARLTETINAEKPYRHAYYMMLGEDGKYYVHPDTAKLFKETIFNMVDAQHHPDIVALGHEMVTGKKGTMEVSIGGNACVVCYQPVPNTKWSLALVCPESDIYEGYNRQTTIVGLLTVAGLLLILLLCSRIVRHAVAPLNKLLMQSQRIAEGKYDLPIDRSRRTDVIGRLQNSFATMLTAIRSRISEIQQMNAESEEHNDKLQKARQLAEEAGRQKQAFIQNMTHQIRTPLNIIMGFSQVLRDTTTTMPQEEFESIMGMIDHSTKSLTRMVQMLYDSSETGRDEELQSHHDEEVNCNEVARESIAYTRQHYPGLPIDYETALPDSYTIRSNRLYLMRTLREVLYNAAKYSDGQHISLKLTDTDSTVRFVIEDTGPGIAQDYHEKIFVPFSKVDDLSEGLGLGLPLAKRHATNMGGSLTLDADYHDGCRFILEIPLR